MHHPPYGPPLQEREQAANPHCTAIRFLPEEGYHIAVNAP